MDVDELAIKAKGREEWALLQLWEAVRRFTHEQAYKYIQRGDNAARLELDDLLQAGFLAMVSAVEYFEPGTGSNFLTVYKWFLRSAFAEAGGHRSKKRDPLLYAESLDLPAWAEDPDSESGGNLIEDPAGEYAFLYVEYADFLTYCRWLLLAAMRSLTPDQSRRIYNHYFRGETFGEIAGDPDAREKIRACIDRGLRHMRRGKYHKELREALTGFEDFRELKTDPRRYELKALQKQS